MGFAERQRALTNASRSTRGLAHGSISRASKRTGSIGGRPE